jgi:hypothetical protein
MGSATAQGTRQGLEFISVRRAGGESFAELEFAHHATQGRDDRYPA